MRRFMVCGDLWHQACFTNCALKSCTARPVFTSIKPTRLARVLWYYVISWRTDSGTYRRESIFCISASSLGTHEKDKKFSMEWEIYLYSLYVCACVLVKEISSLFHLIMHAWDWRNMCRGDNSVPRRKAAGLGKREWEWCEMQPEKKNGQWSLGI